MAGKKPGKVEKIKVGTCESSPGRLLKGKLYVGKFEISGSEDKEIHIPVFIVQGKFPGPTCFVVAGLSGTHVTGVVSSYKLLESLDPEELKGSLAVFPLVNTSGYFANSKPHPYDGKVIDELFPGFINGSVSEQIAAYVFKELNDKADFVINLVEEAGNVSTMPYVKVYGTPKLVKDNTIVIQRSLAMGTDIVELEDPIEGNLAIELDQKSKIPVMAFYAGGKSCDAIKLGVEHVVKALRNLLMHEGMLDGSPDLPGKQYVIKQKKEFFSSSSGSLILNYKVGEYVRKADVVMTILNPETGEKIEVQAETSGFLFQLNEGVKVIEGDKLFTIVNLKSDRVNKVPSLDKESLKVVKNPTS